MQTMSHTTREAFARGAWIAKPDHDVAEQIVTVGAEPNLPSPPGRPWILSDSEWTEMLDGVRAVCRFLATVCGSQPRQPIPSSESLATLIAGAHGVRFWFAGEGANAEEMTGKVLAFCLRHAPELCLAGYHHDAMEGYSDAELWWDVILPAIERGDIEVTIWGEPLR